MDMIDSWSRESDSAKQKEWIDKINARAYEVVPYLILGQYRQPIAVRANVEGILKSGEIVFWNIEKK
jgi:peptide/nickel transport system substrate-binding protein